MSIEAVREYLSRWNRDGDILEMGESTATVQLAAEALGTQPERIAKTLSFYREGGAMIVVAAGDAKVDNKKFRARFGFKARMLSAEDALRFTGHPVGGVCPFALPEGVQVYLDRSLCRFETVYPACGTPNSAIKVTPDQLEQYSGGAWVDVTKLPEPQPE